MISQEEKARIANALKQRISTFECPMCKKRGFTLLDGYTEHHVQDDLKSFNLGGNVLPTAVIVCNNCGFVSQHSLGVLGLLDIDRKDDNPEGAPNNKE